MTLSQGSPVDPHTATPRILIRLRRVERKHESVSADGGLVLNWPFDKAGRKAPWLFADFVSCNAAARAAWRLSEPSDLPSLVYLAKADPSFSGMLAMVALSVAAPQGGALQMQPEPRLTFRPKPEHASLVPGEWCFDMHASIRGAERDGDRVLCIIIMMIIIIITQAPIPTYIHVRHPTRASSGGAGIIISSSYIRDPTDGTLSPALVLELEGAVQKHQANVLKRSMEPAVTKPAPGPSAAAVAPPEDLPSEQRARSGLPSAYRTRQRRRRTNAEVGVRARWSCNAR